MAYGVELGNSAPEGGKGAGAENSGLFALVFVLVLAAHLGLIFYFEKPEIVFSDTPKSWLDYDTHIEQAWTVSEALDRFGKSWAYEPKLLAGYPTGTIFDSDNKGWELWTFALWKVGLSKGLAFNLFILLAHLAVPWVVFFSARLFGLEKWAALLAASMGIVLWCFDVYPRWCWWVGMTAYAMASYFFLLPLSLFYRYLKDLRLKHLALLALFMSIGHLLHPLTFLMLILPMLLLYARAFKTLSLLKHLGIVGVAVVVLAANSYWLTVTLRFMHIVAPPETGIYGQSTIAFFLTDYLGLLNEPLASGVLANRTGFRFVFLIAATICLVLWRRESDDRFWIFATAIGPMLVLAYVGGQLGALTYIQPYRHVLPAMFLTTIPAAHFFHRALRRGALGNLPRLACAVGGLFLLIAGQNLARDMLYFFVESLPKPHLGKEDKVELLSVNPLVPLINGWHMSHRHVPTFPDYDAVADWVERNDDGDGRILVEWWILGEHLSWRTDAHILGGFVERGVQHSAANLFSRYSVRNVAKAEVEDYLRDYAVKWVIFSRPEVELEKYSDLLTPAGFIPPCHRIYSTVKPVSFFAEGAGNIRTSLNRIAVTDTDPERDAVLRFHWFDTLVCAEGCSIKKEPVENDPVGFIRISAPHPKDFTIENGY